jgi:serine/threonine protein kinase
MCMYSHNYVVDQWLVVKLCDFGMAATAATIDDSYTNGNGNASGKSVTAAAAGSDKKDKDKQIAGTVCTWP